MSPNKPYLKEACVETIKQVIAAEKKDTDRIELCADLHLEGLTPSIDLILKVEKELQIPVRVMIRLRAGNFLY